MIRRPLKILFAALILALWLGVAGLALEAITRVGYHRDREAVAQYKQEHFTAARETAAEIMANTPAPPKPDWAPRDLPRPEVFPTLEEAERATFCDARGEANLICGADGVVEAVYLPSAPVEIVALGSRWAPGDSIAAVLPEAEGQDALNATAQAAGGVYTGVHEYSLMDVGGWPDPYAVSFIFYPFPANAAGPRATVNIQPSKYEKIYFSYRPHWYLNSEHYPLYTQFPSAEFWTNAQGFRSKEVALPKPGGRFRIVCVGGSTTVEGPRNDLTYPAMLEQLLQAQFGAEAVDVVNCGVDALDSRSELQRLPEFVALDPDLVIYYTFANDLYLVYDVLYLEEEKAQAGLLADARDRLRASMFLSHTFPSMFLPDRDRLRRHIETATLSNLKAASERLKGLGIAMAVSSVAIPSFDELDRIEAYTFDARYGSVNWRQYDIPFAERMFDTYNVAAREFCEREGAVYIPVAEEVQGGIAMFNDLVHLTIPGIRRKAEVMADAVAPLIAEALGAAVAGDGRSDVVQ
jgi:lysophospholipase L1-like esterase